MSHATTSSHASAIAGRWGHPGACIRNAPTAEFWCNQALSNQRVVLKDLGRAVTDYRARNEPVPADLVDAITNAQRTVLLLEKLFPREVRA